MAKFLQESTDTKNKGHDNTYNNHSEIIMDLGVTMPFHKKNNEHMLISCGLTSEREEQETPDEELLERQKIVQNLKEQIRTGTYKPTIGEIAISLVRGRYGADCF